jgi:hypothetical protein
MVRGARLRAGAGLVPARRRRGRRHTVRRSRLAPTEAAEKWAVTRKGASPRRLGEAIHPAAARPGLSPGRPGVSRAGQEAFYGRIRLVIDPFTRTIAGCVVDSLPDAADQTGFAPVLLRGERKGGRAGRKNR